MSYSSLPRQSNPRPKKSLAQHFLRDTSYLEVMLNAAQIVDGDHVLEIGPGKGVLTAALADRGAHITAIELDGLLTELLQEQFAAQSSVSIVQGDILDMDVSALVGDSPYKVVANLPYYITSAILRQVLEANAQPTVATVMVQREVAERICAEPGEMSLLAVSVQFYAYPELVTVVPATAFYPQPKVDSAILSMNVRPEPAVTDIATKQFFTVVRAGFGQKRKQITNSLSANLGLSKAEVRQALESTGLDARRRAETFSLQEWRSICIALGRT